MSSGKLLTVVVTAIIAAVLTVTSAIAVLSQSQQEKQVRDFSSIDDNGGKSTSEYDTYMQQMHQNLAPWNMGSEQGGCP
jgi:hypothetical protein